MFDENTPGAKEELFAWLRHMNKYKGSDLFITTNFPPAMKVDGKITRLSDEPLSAEKCMEIAFSIMSSKQIEEFSSTNECNFAISLPDTSPLPCQCNGSTRCDCIGVPLHYQQYP